MTQPLDLPPFHESERDILESMLLSSQQARRQLKREVGPMLIELENLCRRTNQGDRAEVVKRYRIRMNSEFPKP